MPVRTLQGKVVSHKMSKTRTILVNRRQKHPKYGKYINLSTKYHAHDEKDVSKEGDEVLIQECRPISKTKSWKILEVLGGKKPVKKKAEKKVKEEIKTAERETTAIVDAVANALGCNITTIIKNNTKVGGTFSINFSIDFLF